MNQSLRKDHIYLHNVVIWYKENGKILGLTQGYIEARPGQRQSLGSAWAEPGQCLGRAWAEPGQGSQWLS